MKGAIFYENDKIYTTITSYPITEGYVIVVLKNKIEDLHLFSREEYEHLMDVVEVVRNSILRTLDIKKVYLIYMDEIKHMHWHLIHTTMKRGLMF